MSDLDNHATSCTYIDIIIATQNKQQLMMILVLEAWEQQERRDEEAGERVSFCCTHVLVLALVAH